MYNLLQSGVIRLETVLDRPGYHRMMLDTTVPGCHYLLEDKDYYLKELPLSEVHESYSDSILRLALKSAILVDQHYWIMDYVYNATEFEVWALKSEYSEEQITEVCKKLLSDSIHSLFDEQYQSEYGADDGFGMMGVIFEGRIAPGLKVSECGELPNGVTASFLNCDPESIIEELFGKNISFEKKSRLLEEANKILKAEIQAVAPKPVNAKIKAKQEKRQKNWNRAKKGNADS